MSRGILNRSLDFVPCPFYHAVMWTKADDLRLTLVMGLRRGLKLCRGMRRSLTEDEQHKIAGAIVENLERSNWKFEQGPMPEGHSRLMGE
jgi:hypothetical protein